MNIELQIQSLVFSLVFGLFFSFVYNLFYKYLYKGVMFIRIIMNFIFIISLASLYFMFLSIINNGIIHLYFIIMLFIGFIMGNIKTKKLRRYTLEYFL